MDAVLGSARSNAAAIAAGLAWVMLGISSLAQAHAFPDHSDPRVGHSVAASPPEVRIWFDGAIEPVFSTLRVENARGQQVDRGDPHVDAGNEALLEVSVPPLPAGAYEVVWSVVARDGHRTEGRFPFQVESP
jgi:methionine-rich copper-binding protein CopC